MRDPASSTLATMRTYGPTDAYLDLGAIRVVGHRFEVAKLDDSALRRIQGFLEHRLDPVKGFVWIEDRSRGRTIEPQAVEVLFASSPAKLWREHAVLSFEGGARAVEVGEGDRALVFGDYWITPEGQAVEVHNPFAGKFRTSFHDGVAVDLMVQAARTEADRQALGAAILDHGGLEEYLRRGGIRVLHTGDFHVKRLDDNALRRIQAFLSEHAHPMLGRIGIEDSSLGRYVDVDARYVLSVRCAGQLWRSAGFQAGELELHEAGPRYTFITDCVGWRSGDDINDMKEHSRPISRRAFLRRVDPQQMADLEQQLGYERRADKGLTMAGDWHVGYFEGTFVGVPAVYFAWSGIEHIFVHPDLWRSRAR
jgi:hypothetical protein